MDFECTAKDFAWDDGSIHPIYVLPLVLEKRGGYTHFGVGVVSKALTIFLLALLLVPHTGNETTLWDTETRTEKRLN